MSEALGKPAPPESDSTPGALLKRERERRALSVAQAAEDLHLDPWIVEAIEANRFQALGAPVYAKGHLRQYAARLELSVEDIVARYDALHDRPVLTDPIPSAIAAPLPRPRRSFKGPVFVVLGLVIVAAVAWLLIEFVVPRLRSTTPAAAPVVDTSTANEVAPTPSAATAFSGPGPMEVTARERATVPNEPTQVEREAPAVAAEAGIAQARTVPMQSAPPTTSPSTATAAADQPAVSAQGAEALQVRLQFSGDSWTEVYDAQGNRLMFAMGSAGRTRMISGPAPLQFTVGSASAVSLEVNGEPVVIPRRDGRESARFVIEANGNLR